MENQLERIKSKLIKRLQEKYGIREVKLETLPVEKITGFENKYQIKLPQEIVDFYKKVSDGVVLYPDEEICNLEPFENWYFDKNLIHTDFNIENDFVYDDYTNISDYSFLYCGTIELMELGCGEKYNIVVKGKHYGEIIGIYEMYLEIKNKKFLDWLEGCIDGTDENVP